MLSDAASPHITYESVQPPAHLAHRFDEGVGVDEAARRLAMSRATFYRRFDELVARGLKELERLTPGRRVFSASSIERVLHGVTTVAPEDGGR